MVKSVDTTFNMGKGKKNKNKKPIAPPKKSHVSSRKVSDESKKNDTKSSFNSKVNQSQDLNCVSCGASASDNAPEWFVQCDDCDEHFHFKCVGITEIREEDPWSCVRCLANESTPILALESNDNETMNTANETGQQGRIIQNLSLSKVSRQLSNNDTTTILEQSMRNPPIVIVQADVNLQTKSIDDEADRVTDRDNGVNQIWANTCDKYQRRLELESSKLSRMTSDHLTAALSKIQGDVDIIEIFDEKQNKKSSFSAQRHESQKKTSTRAASINPQSDPIISKPSLSKIRSRTSSQRSAASLERIQAELELQTQLDEEILALKLEAVQLKEARMRKFMNDKYKAGSSRSGSDRSQHSNATNLTSYVSSWVEDQRKHVKSRSVDDNMMQKVVNHTEFVESNQKPAKAKSIEANGNKYMKTIDEFNFDWSITLGPEERTMLTQLLRKSATSKFHTIPDTSVGKTLVPKLPVDVESDKNNSQSITLGYQDTFNSAKFISNHDPGASLSDPRHYVSAKNNVSQNPQPIVASNQKGLVSQKNQPFTSANQNTTYLCQTQWENSDQRHSWSVPSFEKQHPIASTFIPGYQKKNQTQSSQCTRTKPCTSTTYCQGQPIVSTFVSNHQVNPQLTNRNQSMQPTWSTTINCQSQPIVSVVNSSCSSSLQSVIQNPQYHHYQHLNNPENAESQIPIHTSASYGYGIHGGNDGWNSGASRSAYQASLTANQIAARQVMGKEPLPSFDGNPAQWRRFIKGFETITETCGLSHVESLKKLDKCLQGKAREIVECQLTMPECVPEIIETLRQKFGRPEIIIRAVLAEIRSVPAIKADKLEALSNYGYKVRNVYKTIESLNMHFHLYNPELIQELIDKLPHQTKIDWARYSENLRQASLVDFSDWLYKLSQSINRIMTPEVTLSDHKSDSKNGYVNIHDDSKNKELISNDKPNETKCVICTEDCKFIGECPKFKGLTVDDRWKSLFENKLCRRCLKRHGPKCYVSKECGVNGCTFKHYFLLHDEKRHAMRKPSPSNRTPAADAMKLPTIADRVNGSSNTHYFNDQDTLFRIVPVVLRNKNESLITFAFLDEGSSFTLMERHVAEKLKLKGSLETICLLWTKKVHRQEQSELVNLEISGVNVEPSVRYPFTSVNVVDDLNLPIQSIRPNELAQRFPHLKNLPLIGFEKVTPTIMIGLKHARLITPLETVEGRENDPIATRSRLGWSVYGPTNDYSVGYVNTHRAAECPCQHRDDGIHNTIKEYFSLENFGVAASSMSLESKEDELALRSLKKFTFRKGNRFETRLLWKNENCELPDSYPMAMKRLACLENKGSQAITTINESVEDYLEKGYVSKLSPSESAMKTARTWYLPLFTAINPKKPEKLRTVFDGAARVKGMSLNSVLYTGPDLLVSIVDILRRFREKRIAICGDIKEMYHQVLVNAEDRNSQRFLWRYGDKSREPDVYVMNVMTFGATCSPSAAQYVKNLNAAEFQSRYPRAAEAIIKNHYVDDMMDCVETVKDAIQLVNDVKFVHSQGGFEIRNFKSNSVELLEAIGEPVNKDEKISVENESNLERVLGMFWDTKLDCFTFSLKFTKVPSDILTGKQLPTKREALRLLMSIFDPLGLLSYYLIHLKVLLQDVWRTNIKWDDQIPEDLRERWLRWINILPNVTELKIPRWYSVNLSSEIPSKVEMHIFVDAGEDAFAAVAYLRIETKEGCECSIIGSKSRVSPLKYLSIPRKELMGCVLGARLSNSVQNGLSIKVERRIIWTDSHTVLTWLHSEHRKYSQFVAHRIGEIMESTHINEWRWVPTKLNVADEATKWSQTPTFNSTDRWFKAPEFLKSPESDWPKMEKKIVPNGTTEEMKMSCSHAKLVLPAIADPNRFSKWSRLVRAVAYATRFINILTARIRKGNSQRGPLTQIELMTSEKVLFRQAQWDGYTEEMVTLVRNQKLTQAGRKFIAVKSEISDCSPYLDEFGLLRVKGRIDQAQALTWDAKRPIIMPKNHRITRLLMDSYHVKFMHQNHESVINEVKQRFYIPRIRTLLNSVRWNCNVCELRRCQPKPPQMADLPAVRFEPGIRAFTYTGIDYFGPMFVIEKKSRVKRWGVIMTCLTIRAIHIEIAHSLDTESCIMCVRNFVNLRGRPNQIYSDNGTNLKSADKVLREELAKLDTMKLGTYITNYTESYTQWNFNPPASPHMAGCWERLIRTFKSCLKVSMTDRTPRDEVLRSLLMEVMNIVNSRPLTFVPVGADDPEALTPNHFIFGTSNGLKPPGEFRSDGPYIRDAWKEIQRCANVFWNRFITEYIPTLTRKAKWFDAVKPLAVGDLVLHMDPSAPRNTYDRARIVETITGSNDQVRRAKIQFGDGSTLWRPAVRLALLDVKDSRSPTPQEGLDLSATTSQLGLDPPSGIETGGNNVAAMNLNSKSNPTGARNGTKSSTPNASSTRQLRSAKKLVIS